MIIQSLLEEQELHALTCLFLPHIKDEMLMVDVGASQGGISVLLALITHGYKRKIYAVDIWENIKDLRVLVNSQFFTDAISPLRISSVQASRLFNKESVDFVFIDADHRYSAFLSDLKAWWPLIKVGGLAAGHDCEGQYSRCSNYLRQEIDVHAEDEQTPFPCHPGVVKGLYDFFDDNYIHCEGTRVWYKIKEVDTSKK